MGSCRARRVTRAKHSAEGAGRRAFQALAVTRERHHARVGEALERIIHAHRPRRRTAHHQVLVLPGTELLATAELIALEPERVELVSARAVCRHLHACECVAVGGVAWVAAIPHHRVTAA